MRVASGSDVFEEARANPAYEGMGTTISSIAILGDSLYVGHVGDSRVYLQRKHTELAQLTDDHSLVAEQLKAGLITQEEAETHSLKNLITRAVGIKPTVQRPGYQHA